MWSFRFRLFADSQSVALDDPFGASATSNRLYLVADATADADADGVPDNVERLVYGTSPLSADTDGDGLSNAEEQALGTDPASPTNPSGFVVQYAYDIMDRVTNISWRTTSGATLGGFSYEYDALGRIVSRSHTLGTSG